MTGTAARPIAASGMSLRAPFSRLAALGILCALLWGAYALAVAPIVEQFGAMGAAITEQRRLLGGYRSVEGRHAQESAALQARVRKGDGKAMFLEGESDAIRLASLQTTLGKAARDAGVRLRSSLPVAAREIDGVRLLGVQVQITTTLEAVQRIVFALEDQVPYLVVDTLQISRGPDSEVSGTRELNVRLVVLGASPGTNGIGP